MKTGFLLTSLATLCSIALAGSKSDYVLRPDPEGQYPRLGACPDAHACIFPPDVSTFLPGGYFDLRVEMHAYDLDASKPTPPVFDNFKTLVRRDNGRWEDASKYFDLSTPEMESWNFTWRNTIDNAYAHNFNRTGNPINVDVTSRAWRKVKFDKPGTYQVKVQYGPKQSYTVQYTVVEPKRPKKKAKNVILFISDGTNVGMITAARAVARAHTSGKYHDFLNFEKFDHLGHIITNSVDSIATDSANSASSYSTGHKSSPDALGVYCDSSKDPFDDPKVETITELIRRRQPKKAIGIVTTASGGDATPSAFVAHTRDRDTHAEIIDQVINGSPNWVGPAVPDVWLTGGAEFFKGEEALNGADYYEKFKNLGYKLVQNKKDLKKYHDDEKLLGIFRQGNLDVWFERNIFVNNTIGNKAAPDMSGKDALGSDQPGLDDMTLKALEVLKKRGGKDGFFLMSEAASVDKQLHGLDYPRAWAELIELDVTVKKTVEWLKKNGEFEDTLILVTADHTHSFDVWGSVDQEYIAKQTGEEEKRNAIGVYERAGWPGYFDEDGDGFPDNWNPRVTLAAGTAGAPDHYEAWQLAKSGPRFGSEKDGHWWRASEKDEVGNFGAGLKWNGNLPVDKKVGVHSISDVFIYANGPSSELFGRTYENWDLFFKMTQAMDLQRPGKHEH
ncbi:alkaline-phosphatase-like protein [Radiomyces spectabilis]|uniref:alkaline-phosphatase-like protein n=1 Tax=Radiomyces spectabilis TaxID=64574 RepID=UPI00221F90A8|nr:alkaline-phosphatase-like protein [Radiomyces spectabilis]KAI8394028.1 alkaline-phosphatase-like protein [Radiomyces spectabilis]